MLIPAIIFLISPNVSLIMVGVVGALVGLWYLRFHINTTAIIYTLIFIMIFLEGDYPDYEAITEPIFALFLTQSYIPVVSPFEILSIICALWLIFVNYTYQKRIIRDQLIVLLVWSGLHFIVAVVQMGNGLLQGGALQTAFWQMKSFMVFPIWACIGFYLCKDSEDAFKLLSLIFISVSIKTIYNLWVLVIGMGGTRGTREYVSSHMGSLFMSVSMIYGLIKIKFFKMKKRQKLTHMIAILACFIIWMVNDRRASLMGSVLSAVFCVPIILPYIPRSKIKKIAIRTTVIAIILGATWQMPPPAPGGIIRSFTTHGDRMNENEIDYRDIENYNLFEGISQSPLGRGYGFPFVRYMDMPNIFDLAEILSWVPHNSLLMIWLFGGPYNVATLAIIFTVSIATSVQLFRRSSDLKIKCFGIITFMTMVQWLIYVWADMAWSFVATISIPAILAGSASRLLTECVQSE